MWHYFLNWMGPINERFIDQHGSHWSAGRIDAHCDNENDPDYSPFGTEFGVGPMHSNDWEFLAEWLNHLETPTLLTKKQIFRRFEEERDIRIRWLSLKE